MSSEHNSITALMQFIQLYFNKNLDFSNRRHWGALVDGGLIATVSLQIGGFIVCI
jgi:hypothetical protein